jgi:trehalose 6-phosphate phosphatase
VQFDNIDLRTSAIMLDVDGTILDIAATPSGVEVPARLKQAMAQLAARTDGAFALVSGRPLADLDRLFAPLAVALVGGHGAETRLPGAAPVSRRSPPLDDDLRRRLAEVAAETPGVIVEDKGYSVALHYRLAPQFAEKVLTAVAEICGHHPSGSIELLAGKAVVEVKRRSFDKGTGVRELMARPPFRGRRPVFVGDDVTDEAVFAILPEFDGIGLSVGRRIPGLAGFFPGPEDVRRWIYRLSGIHGENER